MTLTAFEISFFEAKPVEIIIGFLVFATFLIKGMWLISGEAILYACEPILSKKSTALSSNGLEKNERFIFLASLKIIFCHFHGNAALL